MKNRNKPDVPAWTPDWVWELIGVHVVVLLGSYLLHFFAIGAPGLRAMLGLGAWLAGLYLVLGLPLRDCHPFRT